MAVNPEIEVRFEARIPTAHLFKWKVKPGSKISQGTILLLYDEQQPSEVNVSNLKKMKATMVGTVSELLKTEGDAIHPGCPVLIMRGCSHPIVMKDMCAECGADLREYGCRQELRSGKASVAMVHSIPELVVSQEQAQVLGKADEARLLKHKKLVLLVDLDQTLIHTTNDDIPVNLKDVHHFQLYGSQSPWYHARMRPGTNTFLEKISKLFELHICTFGARTYAHTIARILDKDGRYFSHRILSRDECFDPNSKTANLSALFPCGDHLVCIIDDREDVWNFAPNLVHVKPYHFFQHTGDINAPPGLAKKDKKIMDESKFFLSKKVKRIKQCSQQDKKQPDGQEAIGKEKGEDSKPAGKGTSESVAKDQSSDPIGQLSENTGKASLSESADTKDESSTEDCAIKETASTEKPALQDGEITQNKPAASGSENSSANTECGHKLEDGKVMTEQPSTEEPENPVSKTVIASEDEKNVQETASEDEKSVQEMASNVASSAEVDNSEPMEQPAEKLPSNKVAETPSTAVTASRDQKNAENIEINVVDVDINDEVETNDEDMEINVDTLTDASGLSENGILHADGEQKPESADPAAALIATETSSNSEEDELEVEDNDDYLLYLSEILETVHRTFYASYAEKIAEKSGEIPDLKKVIPQVRRTVLKGVKMVFSGIIPTNQPVEKSRAYYLATSLGAEIQSNLVLRTKDNKHLATTHVVAARLGTIKVNEAKRSRGIHVVTPAWLWCCANRWEWVSEDLFPLTKETAVDQKHAVPETVRSEQQLPVNYAPKPIQPPLELFPTYDPVTGKRVNKVSIAAPGKVGGDSAAPKNSLPAKTQDFASSFNPLMSFSSEDIASMDQEVEDLLDSPDSDEEDTVTEPTAGEALEKKADGKTDKDPQSSSSSSSCSLTGERPHGWGKATRKRKMVSGDEDNGDKADTESDNDGEYERPKYPRCELPQDSDKSDSERDSDEFAESVGSVDEEMAAAVEREFLGM